MIYAIPEALSRHFVQKMHQGRLSKIDSISSFSGLSLEEQQKHQLARLNELLAYVIKNVPYYTSRSSEYGPLLSLQEIERLPILTKDNIRSHPSEMLSLEFAQTPLKRLLTSGSSGQPMAIFLDGNAVEWKRAYIHEFFHRVGYRPGHRKAVLWGEKTYLKEDRLVDRLDRLKTNTRKLRTFRLSQQQVDDYVRYLSKFQPQYLESYVSSVALLAESALRQCVKIRPQAVQTTSEMLLDSTRLRIEEAFQCKVFNKYGANEVGPIGQECEFHSGLHINTHGLIVESINREIVITNLYNRAMPFIRYRVGDLGELDWSRCPCGRTSPRIVKLLGRKTDMIKTTTGERIDPYFFTVLMSNIPEVLEYRINQQQNLQLLVKVKTTKSPISIEDKIVSEFQRVDDKLPVSVIRVDAFDNSGTGKFHPIQSEAV